MTDETKATPRPWRIEGPKFCDLEDGDGEQMTGYSIRGVVGDDDSAWAADIYGEHVGIPAEMSKANAELIVRAVNAHDALQAVREQHDAKAREANFNACGCDYCAALALAEQSVTK